MNNQDLTFFLLWKEGDATLKTTLGSSVAITMARLEKLISTY